VENMQIEEILIRRIWHNKFKEKSVSNHVSTFLLYDLVILIIFIILNKKLYVRKTAMART